MKYRAAILSGKGRGKRIGFPTLNIRIPRAFPYSHGIYAGFTFLQEKKYLTAFHFGPIPTFGEAGVSLEGFLIDADLPHAPATIEFELVEFIREIRTFPNADDLAAQITKDVAKTIDLLRNNLSSNFFSIPSESK